MEKQESSEPLSDILKQRSNWNLAADAELLKYLQSLSTKIINNANATLNQLDTFENQLNAACVNFSTLNNKFLALSDSQFLENKLKEEPVETNNTTLSQPANTEDKNISSKLKEALDNGLSLLDNHYQVIQVTGSDSDSDIEEHSAGEVLLKAHNAYKNHKFPYLIGSEHFINDDRVGLGNSSAEEQSSDDDESESLESMDHILLNIRSKDQVSIISDSVSESESSVPESECGNRAIPSESCSQSSSTKNMSYAEQLASRISNYTAQSTISENTATIPPHVGDIFSPPPISDKDIDEGDVSEDNDSGKDIFEEIEDLSRNNDDNIPKYSESESLSRHIPSLFKANKSSSINIHDTNPPEIIEQISNNQNAEARTANRSNDLFGNNSTSVFPEDIFINKNTSDSKNIVPKESSVSQMIKQVKQPPLATLFDDIDTGEDDLFKAISPLYENINKPVTGSSTSDILKNKSNEKSLESLTGSTVSDKLKNQNNPKPITSKKLDLFDDSDSEDDIFSVSKHLKRPFVTKSISETSKSTNKSSNPEENKNKLKNHSMKIENVENSFNLFSDVQKEKTDLFNDVTTVPTEVSSNNIPTPNKTLENLSKSNESLCKCSIVEKQDSSNSKISVCSIDNAILESSEITVNKYGDETSFKLTDQENKDISSQENQDSMLHLQKDMFPDNDGTPKDSLRNIIPSNDKMFSNISNERKNVVSNDKPGQADSKIPFEEQNILSQNKESERINSFQNATVSDVHRKNSLENESCISQFRSFNESDVIVPDLKTAKACDEYLPTNHLFVDDSDDDLFSQIDRKEKDVRLSNDTFNKKDHNHLDVDDILNALRTPTSKKSNDIEEKPEYERSLWDNVPPLPSSVKSQVENFETNERLFEAPKNHENNDILPDISVKQCVKSNVLRQTASVSTNFDNCLPFESDKQCKVNKANLMHNTTGQESPNTNNDVCDGVSSSKVNVTVPSMDKLKRNPGKLSPERLLNINVNALVSNAKWTDIKKELHSQKIEKTSSISESTEIGVSPTIDVSLTSTSTVKSDNVNLAFNNSEILTGFTKERIKIPTKRRPPTRKGRPISAEISSHDTIDSQSKDKIEIRQITEDIVPTDNKSGNNQSSDSSVNSKSRKLVENCAESERDSRLSSDKKIIHVDNNNATPANNESESIASSMSNSVNSPTPYSRIIPNQLLINKITSGHDPNISNVSARNMKSVEKNEEPKLSDQKNHTLDTNDSSVKNPSLDTRNKIDQKALNKKIQFDNLFDDNSDEDIDDLFKDVISKPKSEVSNQAPSDNYRRSNVSDVNNTGKNQLSNSSVDIFCEPVGDNDLFSSNFGSEVEQREHRMLFQKSNEISTDLFPDPIVSNHQTQNVGPSDISIFSNYTKNGAQVNERQLPTRNIKPNKDIEKVVREKFISARDVTKSFEPDAKNKINNASNKMNRSENARSDINRNDKERDIFEEAKEYIKVIDESSDDLFATNITQLASTEPKQKESFRNTNQRKSTNVESTGIQKQQKSTENLFSTIPGKVVKKEREFKSVFSDEEDNIFESLKNKPIGIASKKQDKKSLFGDDNDDDDDIFSKKVPKKPETTTIDKSNQNQRQTVKLREKMNKNDTLSTKSIFGDDDDDSIFK